MKSPKNFSKYWSENKLRISKLGISKTHAEIIYTDAYENTVINYIKVEVPKILKEAERQFKIKHKIK